MNSGEPGGPSSGPAPCAISVVNPAASETGTPELATGPLNAAPLRQASPLTNTPCSSRLCGLGANPSPLVPRLDAAVENGTLAADIESGMSSGEIDAAAPFPPTRWSVVESARTLNEEHRLAALERFLNAYYDALLSYTRRQFRLPEEMARDYLHEFILSRVIRKNLLALADRTRGRFRSFLVRTLNRFIIDELRKARAAKRSPEEPLASLDDTMIQALEDVSLPTQDSFDLEFARGVVQQALARMRSRCEATNRMDLWKVLQDRVLSETLEGGQPLPYDVLAALLGVGTPAQAANLLTTAKRMFGRVFKSVVRDYEADEASVEEEIKALRHALSNA